MIACVVAIAYTCFTLGRFHGYCQALRDMRDRNNK